MILRYIVAIILLSVIVIFHELGHLWLAKANDIKVNEFSLGLGPTLFGFTKGETKYSIKLLPFGGACMMEGEDSDENLSPRSFQAKNVWQRLSVVAAGPIFNFILAFVFSVIMLGTMGSVKPVISGVTEGYPAYEAGLMEGDEIVRLNNKGIHFYKEITLFTLCHPNQPVDVTYIRDGEKYTTTITPVFDEEEGRYLFGLYSYTNYEKSGPIGTLIDSLFEVRYNIRYVFASLKILITGQADLSQMSGVVGAVKIIGDIVGESHQYGLLIAFMNLLNMGVMLSANLGVLNLFPLPALDGGRLLFMIIEIIRGGKKVDPEKEGMVHFIGIIVLLALMALIMFNDVNNIFIKHTI